MKPNLGSAKRGRAPFAIVFAIAALLALPIVAAATHWPNFGGDAGHSGNQPVNAAEMAISSTPARYNDAANSRIETSTVISGGDAASGQRISYGSFVDVADSESDENRVHIRDLATGAEKVTAADQLIENDSGTDDNDVFGPGDRFVTPVSSSTDGGLGQLYVVHNDSNSAAQTAHSNCQPSGGTGSDNDIAIAQFDESTGAKQRDVAVGQAQGRSVQGQSDPSCPLRTQISDGYSVESSPVLTPPLDGSGRRLLFFTGKAGTGTTHRLYRIEIQNAGSTDATIASDAPQFRDIPNLNTAVPPTIAYFTDPASGFEIPYVVVAVNAAAGASDIRALKAEDIGAGEVELSVPADIPGDPQAISVPATEDGQLPGPASGDEKAPALYAAYRDGEMTRVHRFVQDGSDQVLDDTVPSPPALEGTPGPAMALSQVVSGGQEQEGRVIVATTNNLFALDKDTLAPVERLRDEGESLLEPGVSGFSRNAPLTSGGFVFISDDGGIPYVLDLSDLERVDAADFTPEGSHLESDYALGQPSYSNGHLAWATDRGLYIYTTGVVTPPNDEPTARFTASPNPAQVNQPIVFDASASSDPEGKGISKYEWDFDNNGTYEVSTADPKYTAAFPAPGTFTVGLRVTDNAPAEGAPVRTATTTGQVVINPPPPNRGPEATFTVTPNPARVDQRVTFDASATKDPEGHTLVKFEWDLDGNGTYETNSGVNPRVQRSYGRANVYNVKLRVTDSAGGATEVLRQLAVTGTRPRRSPRRLTAKVTPKRDRAEPFRFRTTGRLTRPSGVSRASGCTGRVTVTVKAGRKTISRRTTALRSNCTYRTRVTFSDRERLGKAKRLRFIARFQGNKALRAKQARSVRVRIR